MGFLHAIDTSVHLWCLLPQAYDNGECVKFTNSKMEGCYYSIFTHITVETKTQQCKMEASCGETFHNYGNKFGVQGGNKNRAHSQQPIVPP